MSPFSTNFLIKKDNIFYFTVPPYGKGSDRLMKLTEREVKQFSQNPETYYHEVQRDGKRYLNFNREDIFINYQDGIAHSKGGILLNDKNSLILFGPRKIFLYDIKANKFLKETQELPPFYTESIILHTSVLKNGNVLMITAKYPLRNRLIEINPYTLIGDLKSYIAPGQWAAITDLNNGEIVYSGGMNFSNNPYKRYKVSNKIYLWKK